MSCATCATLLRTAHALRRLPACFAVRHMSRTTAALSLCRPSLPSSSTSSTSLRGAFMGGGGEIDRKDEKPQAFHLEHIARRLEDTVPLMFRQRLDYTFYRKDVVLEDQLMNKKIVGLDQLQAHIGSMAVTWKFFLPHVQAEAISIHPMVEDGTVRLRWRVKYVSLPRLLMNPKLFRYEHRMKNLSWFDGYSVFSVDGNGDVYHFTLQKTQVDEDGKIVSGTKRIAQKIGVLPGANASFQRVRDPGKKDRKE